MALLKRWDKFSTVGVSIVGGISHNLGQVLVAILLLENAKIGYYMIVLTVSGIVAGTFIGIIAALIIKYLKNVKL